MSLAPLLGIWTIMVQSPLGSREVVLRLEAASDGGLTGSMRGPFASADIKNATMLEDGAARWDVDFPGAIGPLVITFTARAEGDTISGDVRFGVFGGGSFSGTRTPAED